MLTKCNQKWWVMYKRTIHSYIIVVTSNCATSRQSSGQLFQDTWRTLQSLLSPCPSTCDATDPYRSIDGCCNNVNLKDLGSTNEDLDPVYEDNIEVPRGGRSASSLQNARDVSSSLHSTKPIVSLMVMQFGQFLDHDITVTPEVNQ